MERRNGPLGLRDDDDDDDDELNSTQIQRKDAPKSSPFYS